MSVKRHVRRIGLSRSTDWSIIGSYGSCVLRNVHLQIQLEMV